MNAPSLHHWTEQNHRSLQGRLAELRARFEHREVTATDAASTAPSVEEMLAPPALETLQRTFNLSDFERDVLLLSAGVELDTDFARSFATAAGIPLGHLPTFGIAMTMLEGAHWSALSPGSPLRRWRLIDLMEGQTLTGSGLRIEERVLHYLVGLAYLDDRLAGIVRMSEPPASLAPSHQQWADGIIQAWVKGQSSAMPTLIQFIGDASRDSESIAAMAAHAVGLQLAVVRGSAIPASARERDDLIRIWEREAALGSLALFIDCDDSGTSEDIRSVSDFVGNLASPVMVGSTRRLDLSGQSSIQIEVVSPARHERRAMWAQALDARGISLNGQLDTLVDEFSLDAAGIHGVTSEFAFANALADPNRAAAKLWDLCRERVRPRMDGIAHRIDPAASWDDLVLPEMQKKILHDVAVHVRHRGQVYDDWGFASKGRRGLGISALFAGPSGTGKTMAAEVLARELRLELYRIDLSQVVSKYIGETEKNLGALFDAAEGGGVILLFDEADALFGKRSEVRDSHDRYANIEVSYLLQRMEAFGGLAILTTNLKASLDDAFLRRIRFVVQFPFPDADARAAIWRRIFPAETPLDGLDYVKLSRLSVAGGSVRNIAMNAAFAAAHSGEPVRMRHLLQAARSEVSKQERTLSDAEIRGWVQEPKEAP
jgi:hypothetical protein